MVVDVLGVGVRAGVKVAATHVMLLNPGDPLVVQVGRDDVERVVAELMDDGPAGEARRAKAKELAHSKVAAVTKGSSSDIDVKNMLRHGRRVVGPIGAKSSFRMAVNGSRMENRTECRIRNER